MKAKFKIIASVWFFLLSTATLANIGGTDLQNFNPTTNGLDFVTVHSAQTLKSGQINIGAFSNYVTNSLPYSTLSAGVNTQSFGNPNDQILYSNLNFAIGLIEGWDLGLATGFTNLQNIETPNFLFSYGDMGFNEVRINSKLRVFKDNTFGLAVVAGMDFEQIKNNPFMGDNAGPSFHFEGVFDMRILPELLWAINLGYRLRQPGAGIPNTGVTPLSDQITFSTAFSYLTDSWGSSVIAELYGSAPIELVSIPSDRDLSNLEVLLGYRWQGLEDIDLHGGIGSSFYYGLGSPDMRAYVGLNWQLDFLSSN